MNTNESSAREIFLKKYRDNQIPIKTKTPIINLNDYLRKEDRMSVLEVSKAVEEWSKSLERQKRMERDNERKREIKKPRQYVKNEQHVKNKQSHNKHKLKGNIKKKVVALSMAAIMVFGGMTAVKGMNAKNQEVNASKSIEMALQNGATLETLGIDSETLTEIKDIESMLGKKNLTNKEIIELAPKINSVYFDIVKGKLANALGVEKYDVKIYADVNNQGKPTERVEVSDGRIFKNKDMLTNKNTISDEIAGNIQGIAKMQGILENLQQGDFKREDIINEYRKILNTAGEFASSKIEIDEKGNISVSPITRDDLDKYDKAAYDAIGKTTSANQQNELDER